MPIMMSTCKMYLIISIRSSFCNITMDSQANVQKRKRADITEDTSSRWIPRKPQLGWLPLWSWATSSLLRRILMLPASLISLLHTHHMEREPWTPLIWTLPPGESLKPTRTTLTIPEVQHLYNVLPDGTHEPKGIKQIFRERGCDIV